MKAQRSAKYIDANLYWDWCEDNAHQKEIIYLEKFTSNCGDQGGIGNVWGFVSLGYNPNDPDYPFTIEICQLHSGTMWGYFEEAYGTWASTGIVDRFGDDYGGPCKVLTVLFNVRKFYAEWGGDSSYWVLSWPLAP
jgi:hypothetical protein